MTCWFNTRSGASLPCLPPPPGPAQPARTDGRTLTLGVAEAAAVADAGAAPALHPLQVLAVEEAAPAGGAGELRQHRVELAQRLRQVPAVLPRRCRAATAASGPDRTFPTRPGPRPPPRPHPGRGKGMEEKGEGRERGPARPLSPPLPPCPAGRWAGGGFMAAGGDAPAPLPPPAASDSARARRSPSYSGAGAGRAGAGRAGGGPGRCRCPGPGVPAAAVPPAAPPPAGSVACRRPPAAAPSGGSRCADSSTGCAPGCCGGNIQRESEPTVRGDCHRNTGLGQPYPAP